jgi:hypothetical protein
LVGKALIPIILASKGFALHLILDIPSKGMWEIISHALWAFALHTHTHLHLIYETSALAEFQSTYMHKVMSILDTWMKEPKVEEEEEEV